MRKIKDENFEAVYDSCVEGLSGEWDCSTEEGREGFRAMMDNLESLAKRFHIDTSSIKEECPHE
jgi:hypothetical protein